jgi:hypothetical protein
VERGGGRAHKGSLLHGCTTAPADQPTGCSARQRSLAAAAAVSLFALCLAQMNFAPAHECNHHLSAPCKGPSPDTRCPLPAARLQNPPNFVAGAFIYDDGHGSYLAGEQQLPLALIVTCIAVCPAAASPKHTLLPAAHHHQYCHHSKAPRPARRSLPPQVTESLM